MPSLLVCMTGASGCLYGVRLLESAVELFDPVSLVLSTRSWEVIRHELGVKLTRGVSPAVSLIGDAGEKVRCYSPADMNAPFASGSAACDAMVVAPCTMGTVARIASGSADDLITRAADVCLKERKRLLLVPRETPFSQIHLRNLLELSQAGAVIVPASPPFYHRPQSIEELIQPLVDRLLALAGAPRPGAYEWAGADPEP